MTKDRILITGTVTNASEENINLYNDIIDICSNYSENISSPLDTMVFKGTNEERYLRAMELLQGTKLLIAEMSYASTGQGMELQEAIRLNIPIIVIAKENTKISGLLLGTNKVKTVIYYNNIDELKQKLSNYLKLN